MNDNSLGIKEAKATVVKSSIDEAMQPYIDSGKYSAEELEKIRKRLANQEVEEKKKPIKRLGAWVTCRGL